MISKPQCPEALRNCQNFFDQLVHRQIHPGTASINLLGPENPLPEMDNGRDGDQENMASWRQKAKKLPLEVVSALTASLGSSDVPSIGVCSSYISIKGLSYCVASQHAGNSQIMIHTSEVPSQVTPAVIRHIFQVCHKGSMATYLLVERLVAAKVQRDPFARYVWPRMGLYDYSGQKEVIDPDNILSHFAQLPIVWEDRNISFVVSLSRS